MWVTYKFYDEKGRRLTIVGRVVADSAEEQERLKVESPMLEIQVVTCSKHDEFSKKAVRLFIARLAAGDGISDLNFHPLVYHIPIKDGKPKWTFINWCQNNFYKREIATFGFDAYVLCRDLDVLPGIQPCGRLEFVSLRKGKVPKKKGNGI